jgi:choline kinase
MKTRAVILAAGRGSRLGVLTAERPKCLLEVGGEPLLHWQLRALRGAGIEDIAIVTGYRRDLLASAGLVEFHNPRWRHTNMVSSLECASPWLAQGPCIVSYSDIFYHSEAVSALLRSEAPIALTYDPHWHALWERRFDDPLLDAETFRRNADGSLAEIGGRPKTLAEVEGQYMGLLLFRPQAWAALQAFRDRLDPELRAQMHLTGTLRGLLEQGQLKIDALPYLGVWGEVDGERDLSVYQGVVF